MSIFITIVVCFVNLVNLMCKKHKNIPIFLFVILLCVLMGANTQNPDIENYISGFNTERIGPDFGYSILVHFFYFMGFDYESFRLIISVFGILLIHQTVKKFIINKSAFYLLYFIYPFMIDIVQIRNFLVMSILIYAVPCLLTQKYRDYIKFVVYILIASTIQLTAIIYLPIVFLAKAKKNMLIRSILFFNILGFIIIVANKDLFILITNQITFMLGEYDNRITKYGFIQTNYGFLLPWAVQLTNFFLVTWARKIYSKRLRNEDRSLIGEGNKKFPNKDESIKEKYILLIYWINVYAFLFLPFYVFQMTFSRFIRNIIPLNLMVFLIAKKRNNNYLFGIIYLSYHIFILCSYLYWVYPNIDINDFFEYNWLIGK